MDWENAIVLFSGVSPRFDFQNDSALRSGWHHQTAHIWVPVNFSTIPLEELEFHLDIMPSPIILILPLVGISRGPCLATPTGFEELQFFKPGRCWKGPQSQVLLPDIHGSSGNKTTVQCARHFTSDGGCVLSIHEWFCAHRCAWGLDCDKSLPAAMRLPSLIMTDHVMLSKLQIHTN